MATPRFAVDVGLARVMHFVAPAWMEVSLRPPVADKSPYVALVLIQSLALSACTRDSVTVPDGSAIADLADVAADDLAVVAVDLAGALDVSVTVDPARPGASLDSRFAGLSYEKSTLPTMLFSGANRDLIGLFKRLGPGLLRVGGNSVDRTTWNAAGPGLTAGTIAPADVDRLATFLRATDWRVIYAVNLAASTPAAAASEAQYAARSLGDRLFGFEIGNECDLYKGKYRPATYSYTNFRPEWESYATAIRGSVPAAVLTGPASAYNVTGYTVPFAADEAVRIALLTQHYYVANGMDPTSTITKLLMPDPKLSTMLAELDQAARAAKIANGFRLAEANSYYNGGASGVSDSFASSLWAIDFLFALAGGGASGVNFHGGGNGPGYTPIANDGTGKIEGARPEYYGILLFDLAAHGQVLPTTVSGGGAAVSAHAVADDDGSTVVILINKDETHAVVASVDFGAPRSSATQLTLTAPTLASTSGVLLGGAAIGTDGSWAPTMPPVAVAGRVASVAVPPGSAVSIRAR
jgi:hypothetical protein